MIFDLRTTRDLISRRLAEVARRAKRQKEILKAMADTTVAITKRAFYEPSLRPSAWPNKADGTEATLRWKQVLRRSPDTKSVSDSQAIIGSDRDYAAIHQLGGTIKLKAHTRIIHRHTSGKKAGKFAKKKHADRKNVREEEVQHGEREIKMPARPYFPFTATGKPVPWLKGKLSPVIRRKLGLK